MPRHTFFATCAPGIEPVIHAEAKALRLAKVERQIGGVRFEGEIRDAWRANLWLRTAVRVLLRLERFQATDGDALYAGVREIDWSRFVVPEGTIVVDAQSKESALDHTRFVEQRTKDAICDQFREGVGQRPSVDRDDPALRVHVHIFRDRVTVSADSSGDSLHKRGWRRTQGRAPLAETLAAAIVQLSGWDGRAPLIDPFCGSGTVLVEAGMLAANVAPGLFRGFGFERWPGHDAEAYSRCVDEARDARSVPRKLRLVGRDWDPARIEEARANVEAVGLGDLVELSVGEATAFGPKLGWNAWIVTNPPYGERVGQERELIQLYRRFGELLRESCSGYTLGLLSGNPKLVRALELPYLDHTPLRNGSIECELVSGRIE